MSTPTIQKCEHCDRLLRVYRDGTSKMIHRQDCASRRRSFVRWFVQEMLQALAPDKPTFIAALDMFQSRYGNVEGVCVALAYIRHFTPEARRGTWVPQGSAARATLEANK